MAHCCDGCAYERPGGQCAREDTYLAEHGGVERFANVTAKIMAIAVATVAVVALIVIALVAML